MISSTTASLLLALLLLPQDGAKDPQEEWNEKTCQEVKIWDLHAGKVQVGDLKVYVDAKYGGKTRYINDLVSMVRFVPRGWDPSPIDRLLRRGDNIRFYGVFMGPVDKPGGSFDFYRLEQRKGDDEEFADRRRNLKEDDVDGRLEVGDWAMARYRFYVAHVESLQEKAKEIFEEAVGILEKEGSQDDFDHQFRIARILLERIGDRNRALAKLKETCLRLRPDDPDLREYLEKEIGAILYRGDWVPYEEFKTREGFKEREDGTWVRDPIDLLEQFVKETLSEPQTVPDDRAEAGDVVKGMKPAQVIRGRFVATRGSSAYPEYVLRVSLPRRGTAEIWVYPDLYLLFRPTERDSKLWKNPISRR